MIDTYSTPGLVDGVRIIKGSEEKPGIIKVAAYCRVSTDLEIQQRSLDIQIEAFNKVIREHPGWELAGIYADKGISGTSIRHREEFKRMIADAKAGKIQYILAKSISRFARNTVDVLTYVRELKGYGVSVFFEKEKLDTGNVTSEFLLSIFAANAQEEISSLSNNMKVGRRMRAASGIAQWQHLFGFRRDEEKNWIVEENEAEIVRRVFKEYVEGRSLPEIAAGLTADGIPTVKNVDRWDRSVISNILHNERYIGDILLQKSFISDPIMHTRVNNKDAKLKQYYIENNHPAIVPREQFHMAQTILLLKDFTRGSTQYPFYGFLKCPICGANMVRFDLPRNNNDFAWTCGGQSSPKGNYRKDRSSCPPFYFVETYLHNGFWEAMKNLDKNRLQEIADGKSSERRMAAREILRIKPDESQPNPKIEYKMLCDLVRKISFPQWDIMKVNWKCGLISETKMIYKKAGDNPYPTIEKKIVEHTTKQKGTFTREAFVVNGQPLFCASADRQIASIKNAHEALLNVLILDPKPYEADVPCVYGYKSISGEKPSGGKVNDHTENCTEDRA